MGCKKYVLTGGPCSGKTSVLNDLKKKGFSVLEEIAREILETNKAISLEESQIKMFAKQLKKEEELEKKDEILILDRGIYDYIAYSNFYLGHLPKEIADYPYKGKYEKVFVLERFPFVNDGLRIEKGDNEAKRVHEVLISTYNNYGYSPIKVPVMSVEKRSKFILDYIGN